MVFGHSDSRWGNKDVTNCKGIGLVDKIGKNENTVAQIVLIKREEIQWT
jgi:hypothetical protein